MGYPHDSSKAICKECCYKETIQVNRGRKVHMCKRFEMPCNLALTACPYIVDQIAVTEHIAECEQFNLKFEHRYSHLEDCLGFHI